MVKLVEAFESDIELIRTLAEKSWKSAYAKILSPDQIDYMLAEMYSYEEILSHIHNPNYHYFIITSTEVPAGFMGFQNRHEADTTKLHRIYLLENYKGQGLGKQAINFLKEKTTAFGDNRIILNVNKDNPAKTIYESQGFTVFDEKVFDIGNGFVMDDYLMEIRL